MLSVLIMLIVDSTGVVFLKHSDCIYGWLCYVSDVVAEWIAHGTLNMHVAGMNLSAASWLTM